MQYKTRQGKARQGKARQGTARQYKATQSRTAVFGQCWRDHGLCSWGSGYGGTPFQTNITTLKILYNVVATVFNDSDDNVDNGQNTNLNTTPPLHFAHRYKHEQQQQYHMHAQTATAIPSVICFVVVAAALSNRQHLPLIRQTTNNATRRHSYVRRREPKHRKH